MMCDLRRLVASVAGLSTLALSALALAGPFGGFSRDGTRYLDGSRVCQPVSGARGAPRCEKKGADEIARLGFRKGTVQRGAGAAVAAQVSGTRLVVRSADGKTALADWDSGNPVGAVSAVYLGEAGKLVAIEYDARLSGRSTPQVVVLALSSPVGGGASRPSTPSTPAPSPSTTSPSPSTSSPTSPSPASAPTPDDPKLTAQLRAADKQLARKKWKQAEAEFRGALALSADHPAARYGVAASLAGQRRSAEALAELSALARSTHPQAPRWLVEARLGPHFTGLQGDAGFRRTVGIDRDPARAPSAYERIIGPGGRWEQTGTPCQEPTVDLMLDRKSEKFQLTIRVRCQGDDETTRLSGTWKAEGAELLRLRFPNVEGPEEQLTCKLAAAPGPSAEDTLGCSLEDLQMTLRIVRR
jgi:hypothetical protein